MQSASSYEYDYCYGYGWLVLQLQHILFSTSGITPSLTQCMDRML